MQILYFFPTNFNSENSLIFGCVKEGDYASKVICHGGMLISKTFTGFCIRYPERNICIIVLGNDDQHDSKRALAYNCLEVLLAEEALDYMGEIPPKAVPVKFVPDKVSAETDELSGVFTPNGLEFFYTIRDGWTDFKIYHMEKVNSVWSEACLANFSSDYLDSDPCISSDGKSLFFCSTRPIDLTDQTDDWNIWVSTKKDIGWTEPDLLPFNTLQNEMYVSITLLRQYLLGE